MSTLSHLLLESLLFSSVATAFLVVVGWLWRSLKSYSLPTPLPAWFKVWFLSVQIGGGLLPLLAIFWGIWHGFPRVLTVLIPYFVILGAQIPSEIVALRQFQSVVWVMVPYLYIPYRLWQLYEGWMLLGPEAELIGVRNLLIAEIILWIVNYGLDLSQLPRLLRWQAQKHSP